MIHKRISGHFFPHTHESGELHRAHAVSLTALYAYLQIFVILVAGIYIIRVKAPHILGTASFSPSEIVAITNTKRAENGLSALSENSTLAQASSNKASDMFANDYWAHNSPSGKTPWSFITGAGYRYIFAGENLARDFSDAQSVVNAWMDSPSHRSNLLDKNFKEIGVAVSNGKLGGKDGSLVVQMFGSRISTIPNPAPVAAATPPAQPSPSPATAGTQIKASPTPAASVAPSSSPSPSEAPVAIVAPPVNLEPQPITPILATRQFSIAKAGSLALIGFIFLLFSIEAVVAIRNTNMKVRSELIAHLLLLGFVLIALWYAVGGAIL